MCLKLENGAGLSRPNSVGGVYEGQVAGSAPQAGQAVPVGGRYQLDLPPFLPRAK